LVYNVRKKKKLSKNGRFLLLPSAVVSVTEDGNNNHIRLQTFKYYVKC
jgi:hypothetical protein